MAFESLGLGGVLKFDAESAVHGMHKAEHGLHALESRAGSLSGHIGHLKHNMESFSAAELAVGVGLGIGLEQMIHHGIEANEKIAQAKMGLAIVFSAATKRDYEEMYELAGDIIPRLAKVAAETMGTTDDVLRVFQRVAPAMTGLNATANQMIAVSKGAMIAAGALKSAGLSYDDVASSMQRLARGMMNNRDPFVGMMKSMGLLTEDTVTWMNLKPEQRLQRLLEISHSFEKYGDKVGESFGATWTTLQSFANKLLRTTFGGLFESIEHTAKRLVDASFEWSESLNGVAETVGEKLVPVFDFLVEQVIVFWGHLKNGYTWLSGIMDSVKSTMESLGIDFGGFGKSMAGIAVQFGLLMTVAYPVLTIVTGIAGKLWSVVSIFMTLGEWIMPVLTAIAGVGIWPIVLAIGAIVVAFMAFREEGESAFGTVKRAAMVLWSYIEPLWESLKTLGEPLVELGQSIWTLLKSIGSVLVAWYKNVIFPIVGWIADLVFPIITYMYGLAVKWIGFVIQVVSKLFDALSTALDWVTSALGNVKGWFQQLMAYIEPVLSFIWAYISTVGTLIFTIFKLWWGVLSAVGSWLVDQFVPIWHGLVWVAQKWWGVMESIGSWLKDQFMPVWNGVVEVAKLLGNAIQDYVVWALRNAAGMLATLLDGFNAVTDLVGVSNSTLVETAQKMHDFADNKPTLKEPPKAPTDGANMSVAQQALDSNAENMSKMSAKDLADVMKKGVHLENKLDMKLTANVHTDGRKLAGASARHKAEIDERAGYNQQPWQRQVVQISSVERS